MVDDNQKPITGARIRIAPLPGGDYSPELKPLATDADGRFEHKGVLPGTSYNVMSESVQVGFKMLASKLAVAPGETIDLGTINISSDKRPEPTRTKAAAAIDANGSDKSPTATAKQ